MTTDEFVEGIHLLMKGRTPEQTQRILVQLVQELLFIRPDWQTAEDVFYTFLARYGRVPK